MSEAPPQQLTGHLTEVALRLQRTLAQDPTRPDALVGMSLVALASGQPAAAIAMAQCAVRAAPHFSAAWIALGQAFKTDGRFEQAEDAYLKALELDAMSPLAHLGLGELRMATSHPDAALCEYDLALRHQPAWPSVHMGQGHALACLGRDDEALAKYKTALTFAPRFAAAFVLVRLGRTREAETRYRRALALRPDFAAAWMNLGCLLREDGREIPAEAALLRAVQLRPDLITGWINLALLRRHQRQPAEAEKYLRNAFALDPDNVNTYIAWCQFRAEEHDLAGAGQWLSWALAREPDHAEAVNMLGILLHAEDRYAEAVETFRHAETLGCTGAASNRGNSLMELGRMKEALQVHQAAVEHDPQSPGATYNLALTQLRLGDWPRGWITYESRLRFREVHRTPKIFRQPRWQGEPLNGRRILLHAEQGLGDAIQFCRYVSLVIARGGKVILQVHKPVERLMNSLAEVRAGHAQVAPLGIEPPAFDLECPLMSLPAVFGTTVDSVPWPGLYLGADPKSVGKKQRAFAANVPGPRVGIAWAGNPRYKADHRRSMNLRTLVPLLRTPGVTWISLQKGDAAAQLSQLPPDVRVSDGSSSDRDLADTAALVSTLDLIITTDTCIAHLAGAMAKPTWILLPHLADWRWMENIETTPWYPTARLFRQPASGDWAAVLSVLITELAKAHIKTDPAYAPLPVN